MSAETSTVLRSFALAIFLHGSGFLLFKIKATPKFDSAWTEIFLIDTISRVQGAPLETSSDPKETISSFLSLPDAQLSLNKANDFSTNRIKRFTPDPGEDYFKEANKSFAEEMDYFGKEMDPNLYLPLDYQETVPMILLFPEKNHPSSDTSVGLRWYYQGAWKQEIEKKYSALFDQIIQRGVRPASPLVLLLSFNTEQQITQCQIEHSSGDSNLDDSVLLLFQQNIFPQTKRLVVFRGHLTLRSVNTHD